MITKLLAGFALCLLLVSCGASVQSSESYYRPTVMQTFPPKPKDAHIPILASMPKEKGGTIGIMEFSTNKGADFINKCLIHNARKNGGDAVIIEGCAVQGEQGTVHKAGFQIQWRGSQGQRARDAQRRSHDPAVTGHARPHGEL